MDYQERMKRVFNYPLFETLSRRRVHRFGLGYEFAKDDTYRFKSTHQPEPLDELETALLAWAGHGINGLSLGEGQVATGVHSTWNGRTHPNACNDQHALLMIVNDDGVFAYLPPDATQLVEIDGEKDQGKILEFYRRGLKRLSDQRPDFTHAAWISANTWMANQPGSTTFFPVIDLSAEHINHALASFQREKLKVWDERFQRWAGIGKWVDNGCLTGPEVTMRFIDHSTLIPQSGVGFFIAQNISLACEAIGLGCAVTSCAAPVVLGGTPFTEGLGFRFATDVDGELNPVGLDDYLEGFCPPYKSMNDAVDEFLEIRYGESGILKPEFIGPTPLKDWAGLARRSKGLDRETVLGAKDLCNYIFDTYGRFPATADTMQLPIMITVHHLELDFYDHYFPREAVSENVRRHMSDWHGK